MRNINLTAQQRIDEHQKALNLVIVLEKAKKVKVNIRSEKVLIVMSGVVIFVTVSLLDYFYS